MSGTSLDGVDGVLVAFDGDSGRLNVMASATQPFSDDFKSELLALNTPGHNEIHRAALASSQLAQAYAQVVGRLRLQVPAPIKIMACGFSHSVQTNQAQRGPVFILRGSG